MLRLLCISALGLVSCGTAGQTPLEVRPTNPATPPATTPIISIRDPAAMAAELRPAFKGCYEQTLGVDRSVVGCVTMNIKLAPDGRVTEVQPDATSLPASLVDCVVRGLSSRRFEAPTTNPATVVLPLTFVPDDSTATATCSSSLRPVQATYAARDAYQRAIATSGAVQQAWQVREAIAHYRNAKNGWAASIARVGDDESRFWYADAAYWVVVLQIAINQSPSASEISEATAAAVAVREGRSKWSNVGAFYAVMIADKVLQDENRRFDESKGASGIRAQTPPDLGNGSPPARTALSRQAQAAVDARTAFLRKVTSGEEVSKRAAMAMSGADLLMAHGQLDEAAPWLETAQREACAQRLSDLAAKARSARIALAKAMRDDQEAERVSHAPLCT